jgi:hypothetical protein
MASLTFHLFPDFLAELLLQNFEEGFVDKHGAAEAAWTEVNMMSRNGGVARDEPMDSTHLVP